MAISDINALHRLISQHGSIQVSPQHLNLLQGKKPAPFIPRGQHQPPNTGYQVFLTGYASHILGTERNRKDALQLETSINQLRSLPRPAFGGHKLIGSVDTRWHQRRPHMEHHR